MALAQDRAGGTGPLAGVLVADFSHVLSGPFATMHLGDLGATVVKIEKPGRGDQMRGVPPFVDDMSHYFSALNRNKHFLGLDLKSDEGRGVALELVGRADVVVHNFRPGVMESRGLGYEAVSASNPGLIYCEISGFGQSGPLRDRPAYDNVVQAMAGIMSLTGDPDGPPMRAGFSVADMISGIYAVQGILAALYDRQKTGKGQLLDVAMFDTLFNLLSYYVPYSQLMGHGPARSGAIHPTIIPQGSFRTSDGYVVIAAFNQKFWRNLCRALGRPEWIADERFSDMAGRAKHRDQLFVELKALFLARTTAEWSRILSQHDVPYGEVASLPALLHNENVAARGLLAPLGVGAMSAPIGPVKYSSFRERVRRSPGRLGADTQEVLATILGKSVEEIAALTEAGAAGSKGARRAPAVVGDGDE